MKIFWLLQSGEKAVSEIAEAVEPSMQNTSQHLRLMHDKGAVLKRKDGKHVFYRIANRRFVRGAPLIREGILEEYGCPWPDT